MGRNNSVGRPDVAGRHGVSVADCTHHYVIEDVTTGEATGTCKHCGYSRTFKGYTDTFNRLTK